MKCEHELKTLDMLHGHAQKNLNNVLVVFAQTTPLFAKVIQGETRSRANLRENLRELRDLGQRLQNSCNAWQDKIKDVESRLKKWDLFDQVQRGKAQDETVKEGCVLFNDYVQASKERVALMLSLADDFVNYNDKLKDGDGELLFKRLDK